MVSKIVSKEQISRESALFLCTNPQGYFTIALIVQKVRTQARSAAAAADALPSEQENNKTETRKERGMHFSPHHRDEDGGIVLCILEDETVIILVDFENTHVNGMEGYTYLNETDTVVVYYSDENSAVTRGMVEDLKERDVNVRMVKLLKQHANALDMYIASTTGMFLDTGEKICIVSKDKGYAAVRDFWHSLRGAEILLGETIEECFLHSVANDDPRIRRVKERSQKALLTNAFETMNKIPTRPTLSRANARKRRNEELDTTRNLEPVAILPNPLLKTVPALPVAAETAEESRSAVTENLQIEDALPVSVDNVGASAGESGASSLNRGGYTNLRPENNRRSNIRKQGRDNRDNRNGRNRNDRREQNEAVFYGEERMPETADSRAAEKQQRPKEALQSEKNVPAVKEAAVENEQDRLAAEAEKKTTILNEKKNTERVLPRINKNQISYVYDPATGTMKRMEPETETEEKAETKAAAEEDTKSPEAEAVTKAEDHKEEAEPAAETETEAEATEEMSAENEAVSLEALGIVPMEVFEKYGPGVNTPHQYYVKLVKTFGKAVGKEIFNATKKEMQAELKRRKQLQQASESTETEAAAETAAPAETAEATVQSEDAPAEAAVPEMIEAAVTETAEAEMIEEAEANTDETAEEEHPVVEALPVHVENNAIVVTEENADQAPEAAVEPIEATAAEAAGKPENAEVSEEEALAAAQAGRYVQLSMDFAENGDINALTAEAPTEEKAEPQAAERTDAAATQEIAAEAAQNAQEEPVNKPARKRRSRKPKAEEAEKTEQPENAAAADAAEPEKAKKPTRKRTSRKKVKTEGAEAEAAAEVEDVKAAATPETAEPKPVRKRGGRRKKAEAAEAAQAEA